MGVMPKALLAAAAVLMASCASQPNVANSVVTPEGTVQVIDDIYHLTRATPDWIFLEPAEIENTSEYQGRYVFKGESTGKDLVWSAAVGEGLPRVSGPREVRRRARAGQRFVAAAAGDIDMLETSWRTW